MPTNITRRSLLQALGIGAAAAIIEEPIRKLWFVPSSAPVGSRVERLGGYGDDLQVPSPGGPLLDMEALKRSLTRKIRSQEDLDAARMAARYAESVLSEPELKAIEQELFGPRPWWQVQGSRGGA